MTKMWAVLAGTVTVGLAASGMARPPVENTPAENAPGRPASPQNTPQNAEGSGDSASTGNIVARPERPELTPHPEDGPGDRLSVTTSSGANHIFSVEVADDPESQRRGLMFRRHLDASSGMLFDFGVSRQVHMWMKNTHIPLDIIFIAPDGTVVNIEADTVPHSLTRRSSDGPVKAALEINAGLAKSLGIAPGDRVSHPVFDD